MRSGSAQALALAPVQHRGGGEPRHPHCLLPPSLDRRLTRLLVNVTLDRSLWPVHVVLGADATVADLVRAAVHAYEREGRRPPLPRDAAAAFDLHFSKYSLQSLSPEEKVMDLGSRNFFLCARRPAAAAGFV